MLTGVNSTLLPLQPLSVKLSTSALITVPRVATKAAVTKLVRSVFFSAGLIPTLITHLGISPALRDLLK